MAQFQLINDDKKLDESGLRKFIEKIGKPESRQKFAIISIMGPQNGGKSTLLNHLFGTNFKVLSAKTIWSWTTKGVWMDRGKLIRKDLEGSHIIILDLEGSDGRQRSKEDTAFEKRIALFALVVSDVVLINMSAKDVDRQHGSGMELLKTTLEMKLRQFTGTSNDRKTKLLFVLRDMEADYDLTKIAGRNAITETWESLEKPQELQDKGVEELFEECVVPLPHFKYENKEFQGKVNELRTTIEEMIATSERGNTCMTGLNLSCLLRETWSVIEDLKDFDLTSMKEMTAIIKCGHNARKEIASFQADQMWLQIKKEAESGPTREFGKRVSQIIKRSLDQYHAETEKFADAQTRTENSQHLQSEILKTVYPVYVCSLNNWKLKTLDEYKEKLLDEFSSEQVFDQADMELDKYMSIFTKYCEDAAVEPATNWNDESRIINDLKCGMTSCYNLFNYLHNLILENKVIFKEKIEGAVRSSLANPTEDLWRRMGQMILTEFEFSFGKIDLALTMSSVPERVKAKRLRELYNYAIGIAEEKCISVVTPNYVWNKMEKAFMNAHLYSPNNTIDQVEAMIESGKQNALTIISLLETVKIDNLAILNKFNLQDISLGNVTVYDSRLLLNNEQKETLITYLNRKVEKAQRDAKDKDNASAANSCRVAADRTFLEFKSNENWLQLKQNGETGKTIGLGNSLHDLMNKFLDEYNKSTKNLAKYEASTDNREYLKSMILERFNQLFQHILKGWKSRTVAEYKAKVLDDWSIEKMVIHDIKPYNTMFNKYCQDAAFRQIPYCWDASSHIGEDLECEMKVCERSMHIAKRTVIYQKDSLKEIIESSVKSSLDNPEENLWENMTQSIEKLIEPPIKAISSELEKLEVNNKIRTRMLLELYNYVIGIVENECRSIITQDSVLDFLIRSCLATILVEIEKGVSSKELKATITEEKKKAMRIVFVVKAIQLDYHAVWKKFNIVVTGTPWTKNRESLTMLHVSQCKDLEKKLTKVLEEILDEYKMKRFWKHLKYAGKLTMLTIGMGTYSIVAATGLVASAGTLTSPIVNSFEPVANLLCGFLNIEEN